MEEMNPIGEKRGPTVRVLARLELRSVRDGAPGGGDSFKGPKGLEKRMTPVEPQLAPRGLYTFSASAKERRCPPTASIRFTFPSE